MLGIKIHIDHVICCIMQTFVTEKKIEDDAINRVPPAVNSFPPIITNVPPCLCTFLIKKTSTVFLIFCSLSYIFIWFSFVCYYISWPITYPRGHSKTLISTLYFVIWSLSSFRCRDNFKGVGEWTST